MKNTEEGCSIPGCGYADGQPCIGCGRIVEPEILYFGWREPSGHSLNSPKGYPHPKFDSTPWGSKLDGGLAPTPEVFNGQIAEHWRDGWTAIAFWDRSGDIRPGSNSAFLVHAEMTAYDLLRLARKQWPMVFQRKGFPLI